MCTTTTTHCFLIILLIFNSTPMKIYSRYNLLTNLTDLTPLLIFHFILLILRGGFGVVFPSIVLVVIIIAHRRAPGTVPLLPVVFLDHLGVELHPICPGADVFDGFVGDIGDGELTRVGVQRVAVSVWTEVLWDSIRKLDWGDFNQMLDSVE